MLQASHDSRRDAQQHVWSSSFFSFSPHSGALSLGFGTRKGPERGPCFRGVASCNAVPGTAPLLNNLFGETESGVREAFGAAETKGSGKL